MSYTGEEIEKQLAYIRAENAGHPARLMRASAMWKGLHAQLSTVAQNLHSGSATLSPQWRDSVGILMGDRVDRTVASLNEWIDKIATQPATALEDLARAIQTTLGQVEAIYARYLQELRTLATYSMATEADVAALKARYAQEAGQVMDKLAEQFATTAQAVAGSLGGEYDGPLSSGGPSGGATSSGAAQAGAPAGAPAGGAAGGAPAGAGASPAGAAPAGAMPAGAAQGGAVPSGAGPSLAGLGSPTIPPSIPPSSIPPLSPSLPSAGGGSIGLPPLATPTAGLGGIRGPVSAGGAAVPSIPRVANPGATTIPAAVPNAPVVPTGLAGSSSGSPSGAGRFGGVPPMVPPMGAGVGSNSGQPKPGNGKGTEATKGKPQRGTPGVPAKLRGSAPERAGSAVPRSSRRRDDEPTTIELLDEEVWQVDQNAGGTVTRPDPPGWPRR